MQRVGYRTIRRGIRRRRIAAVAALLAIVLAGATGIGAMASGGWWRASAAAGDTRGEPRGGAPASPAPRGEGGEDGHDATDDRTPPLGAGVTLRPGDSGPRVASLQSRLTELGYPVGTLDASYGPATQHAVMAFQKVEGLVADGIAGATTRRALDGATRPESREGGAGLHVEVDLARQVLFMVVDGRVTDVVDVSTGSGETYWQGGASQVATTPPGRFEITWRYDGWRQAALGTLYRPAYFNGGIAIHGSPDVPADPASHGCVRVTNWVMDRLFPALVEGTPVLVF